jgi:hypothetical protein
MPAFLSSGLGFGNGDVCMEVAFRFCWPARAEFHYGSAILLRSYLPRKQKSAITM